MAFPDNAQEQETPVPVILATAMSPQSAGGDVPEDHLGAGGGRVPAQGRGGYWDGRLASPGNVCLSSTNCSYQECKRRSRSWSAAPALGCDWQIACLARFARHEGIMASNVCLIGVVGATIQANVVSEQAAPATSRDPRAVWRPRDRPAAANRSEDSSICLTIEPHHQHTQVHA
jgi:hypothetical protein